jgi:2-polyprenyl-3-methyl-5-hydroxy-6-metoxy-1,4-benzoquinol methylase
MCPCCSSPSEPTAKHFDAKRASRILTAYRKSGPDRTTRGLLQGLAASGVRPRTLLDVGAGFGALTFELIETGVANATCIDMSQAFVESGQAEAQRLGFAQRISWRVADFVAIAPSVPSADLVTLDRVVCCYPAFEPLLHHAATHARVLLAMSYPRNRWFVRLVLAAENLFRQLRGNAFRSFVHPVSEMEAVLVGAGFRRVSHSGTLVWHMDVFRRDAT